MIVLRLQRTGRKNLATYRIVAAEKARPVKGKFLEILGHYLPQQEKPVFVVKTDRIRHWMERGAVPSDTLARLLTKNGAPQMEKYMKRYAKRKPKNAEEAPAETAAPAPAPAAAPEPPVAEAPAAPAAESTTTPS